MFPFQIVHGLTSKIGVNLSGITFILNKRRMRRSRTIKSGIVITAAIVVVIAVIRLFFLPEWVSEHIKSNLQKINGYEVTYRSSEISILTGAFSLHDVSLIKKESKLPLPFFQTKEISFSFDFNSLLKPHMVSEVTVKHPTINFIKGPDDFSSQTNISSQWVEIIENLAEFPVNKILIEEGQINYHDFHAIPKVILSMHEIELTGSNLNNLNGEEKILSGIVQGTGKVADGTIRINMELNAFYEDPMFTLSAELLDLNLADVGDFLKAYGKVNIQQGLFSLYTEAATKGNKIVGYIKPVIEEVTIASLQSAENNYTLVRPSSKEEQTAWMVTTANRGSINEIQFEGKLDDPGMTIWSAAGMTLHNAFVEALVTTLEKSIKTPDAGTPSVRPKSATPEKVSKEQTPEKEGLLKRIFKRKDDKRKKNGS